MQIEWSMWALGKPLWITAPIADESEKIRTSGSITYPGEDSSVVDIRIRSADPLLDLGRDRYAEYSIACLEETDGTVEVLEIGQVSGWAYEGPNDNHDVQLEGEFADHHRLSVTARGDDYEQLVATAEETAEQLQEQLVELDWVQGFCRVAP